MFKKWFLEGKGAERLPTYSTSNKDIYNGLIVPSLFYKDCEKNKKG